MSAETADSYVKIGCRECGHNLLAHATGIGCLACSCAAVEWQEDGTVMAWQELNRRPPTPGVGTSEGETQ